jgi:hypothetical protein
LPLLPAQWKSSGNSVGTDNILPEGEKGVLTIRYNGADGKPESEESHMKSLKNISAQ